MSLNGRVLRSQTLFHEKEEKLAQRHEIPGYRDVKCNITICSHCHQTRDKYNPIRLCIECYMKFCWECEQSKGLKHYNVACKKFMNDSEADKEEAARTMLLMNPPRLAEDEEAAAAMLLLRISVVHESEPAPKPASGHNSNEKLKSAEQNPNTRRSARLSGKHGQKSKPSNVSQKANDNEDLTASVAETGSKTAEKVAKALPSNAVAVGSASGLSMTTTTQVRPEPSASNGLNPQAHPEPPASNVGNAQAKASVTPNIPHKEPPTLREHIRAQLEIDIKDVCLANYQYKSLGLMTIEKELTALSDGGFVQAATVLKHGERIARQLLGLTT